MDQGRVGERVWKDSTKATGATGSKQEQVPAVNTAAVASTRLRVANKRCVPLSRAPHIKKSASVVVGLNACPVASILGTARG